MSDVRRSTLWLQSPFPPFAYFVSWLIPIPTRGPARREVWDNVNTSTPEPPRHLQVLRRSLLSGVESIPFKGYTDVNLRSEPQRTNWLTKLHYWCPSGIILKCSNLYLSRSCRTRPSSSPRWWCNHIPWTRENMSWTKMASSIDPCRKRPCQSLRPKSSLLPKSTILKLSSVMSRNPKGMK